MQVTKSRLVILLLHLIVLEVALLFETSNREKQRKTIKTRMNFDTQLKISSWGEVLKI